MTQSPPRSRRALVTEAEQKGWSAGMFGRLLIVVFAAEFSFFTYAFPTGVVPLVPGEFQTDQAIWIVSGYAIGSAAFAPLLGRLGDRIGKRRVLLIMMAAGILGAVVVTFAPTFGLVIAGRVLQGMSLGIPFMNASLVRDIFPRSTMTLATALVVTGSGVLSIPTSLALGPIIEGLGWRGVVWVPAAYAVVVAVLILIFVPESPLRARGERFDVLGAALLDAAVTCLLVPISFGLVWGWASPQSLGFLAASVVLFVVWIIQARRTASPVIAIRDFSNPRSRSHSSWRPWGSPSAGRSTRCGAT